MTAEAGHSHSEAQSQHASCVWCSMAHVATVIPFGISVGALMLKDELAFLRAPAGKKLLVILLHRIRPPPILQLKDTRL
jgi:hypothetical protein